MSVNSSINWTEATWNPVVGCSKVSEGCANCYAVRYVRRMGGQPNATIRRANEGLVVSAPGALGWSGVVRPLPDRLEQPLHWKKPRMVFVDSLSDLFHEGLSIEYVAQVFEIMRLASWHTFQVLTKRSKRLRELSAKLPWPDNVWAGVTVENAKYVYRIDDLRATGARLKFLSLEPLLGPMPDLNLEGVDWVIGGGESGPKARRMQAEWARAIRDQCVAAGIPFFFKQWGEYGEDGVRVGKKAAGEMLDGKEWNQMPAEAVLA
jgi:protein gp37